MAGNTTQQGVSVTSRALSLLAAFDEKHRSLSLSELSRRAEMPVPTAARLARELIDWGALVRVANGNYVIGRRLWDVGLLAPLQTGLRRCASPFLHDLYAATHATTILAVRDGTKVLNVDRHSGHTSLPIVSDIGTRLPMHCTGVGKVLLAYAPEDVRTAVFANLKRVTPHTITQSERLRHQLDRVLREGYAQCSEEMSIGVGSLAVPVKGSDEVVIAALGVVVADPRRDRARLVSAMQVAARGIGRSVSPWTSFE